MAAAGCLGACAARKRNDCIYRPPDNLRYDISPEKNGNANKSVVKRPFGLLDLCRIALGTDELKARKQ